MGTTSKIPLRCTPPMPLESVPTEEVAPCLAAMATKKRPWKRTSMQSARLLFILHFEGDALSISSKKPQ